MPRGEQIIQRSAIVATGFARSSLGSRPSAAPPNQRRRAPQLLMLYDAATIAVDLDGNSDAAAFARDAAERLIASWG